jgi:glycosyltransferase involved in cell wall biosynthesis
MASFIQKDLDIISKDWEIVLFEFRQSQKGRIPFEFLRQIFFLLSYSFSAKRLVCMFGGYHSLLPSLFGRICKIPVWIVLGGYDCYSFPEIKYGAFHKKWFSRVVALSYRFADLLSPVHESMVNQPYTYYNSGYPNQGFRFFLPELKTRIETINNGYEPDKFPDLGLERKPFSFLTVARDTTGSTYFRKGIDLVLEIAPLFPEFSFTIIGKPQNQELNGAKNVTFMEPVPYVELMKIYNRHQFYLQLSIAEGFPNALSEAMLCGCIPIGSNVFGIPDLIGDSGFLLMHRDVQLLKNLFGNLKNADLKPLKGKARKRVSLIFNLDLREKAMRRVLKEL